MEAHIYPEHAIRYCGQMIYRLLRIGSVFGANRYIFWQGKERILIPQHSGPGLDIKTAVLAGMEIFVIKIRQPRNGLIFMIGFCTLVRHHRYIGGLCQYFPYKTAEYDTSLVIMIWQLCVKIQASFMIVSKSVKTTWYWTLMLSV